MAYSYARPMVNATSTVAVFYFGDPSQPLVYLGKRNAKTKAFPNMYCLPGGFVEPKRDDPPGENVKTAAVRELEEEIGIPVTPNRLRIVDVYSEPDTDPRGHVINTAFYVVLSKAEMSRVKPGDDLVGGMWVAPDKAPKLAFDHSQILKDAIEAAQPDLQVSSLVR